MEEIKFVPSITYTHSEGEESLTFRDFARHEIQDLDEALELVERIKEAGGELTINEDTEFEATYTVIDPDVLSEQIRLEKLGNTR